MVDDFIVYVDGLISTACFESASSGADLLNNNVSVNCNVSSANNNGGSFSREGGCSERTEKGDVIECRICQEEDELHAMEAPCACNGTLKFAHRRCIQRWCNKKGDITCEICNQIYAPNYSRPPARPISDGRMIDIRQSWGGQIDMHDSRLLALAAAEHRLLQAEYEEYAAANSSGMACCRSAALILMLLLLLRHALAVTRDFGPLQDGSTFFLASFCRSM
ncbi:E3 ubiquitin-protein ligase MARCH1 isoform X2 [Amborella trichopoda]|uniref:E3 ubiquitin-protein ligase MARCH1 isoform X2 n=1 Tax=Amborella trichopoda TaxID=13333 RepID=UPI0005D3FEA7|nr:E3 ubiquitin-protein ligase MARCH1 isoform X2 [Amborella trichopoda]|eukprot:XP_011628752.1 E3 ubiquitin-protein ligase MARCH1 isoform X2 [Amborella trichopoda]